MKTVSGWKLNTVEKEFIFLKKEVAIRFTLDFLFRFEPKDKEEIKNRINQVLDSIKEIEIIKEY